MCIAYSNFTENNSVIAARMHHSCSQEEITYTQLLARVIHRSFQQVAAPCLCAQTHLLYVLILVRMTESTRWLAILCAYISTLILNFHSSYQPDSAREALTSRDLALCHSWSERFFNTQRILFAKSSHMKEGCSNRRYCFGKCCLHSLSYFCSNYRLNWTVNPAHR